MGAVPIKAFFSCSFAEHDKPINEFFTAICEGLGFECINVSAGDSEVPANVARRLISEASVFIAIIVKRDGIKDSEKFKMPESVANELGMAFGQEKRILMFAENCVQMEGLTRTYGTYLGFDRAQVMNGTFLKAAVESVDRLRQSSYAVHDFMINQHPTEYYALKAAHSYALDDFGNGLEWRHSMRRKIRFTKAMQRPLKISRWNDSAEGKASNGMPSVEVVFEINRSTRKFVPTIEVVGSSAYHIDGDVTFEPNPIENDEIEYTVTYKGAHLMPVYLDEVTASKPVHIGGQIFRAFDGVIPVTPIEVLEIEFRFAAIAVGGVQPQFFVGSYSKNVDYLVDSEVGRAKVKRDEIGANLVLRATVSSALLRHVYGVAWEPPVRPVADVPDVAGAAPS
jgi:hypothetical protein